MLCLSARIGEVIWIDGGRIKVTVGGVKGGTVKMVFDADRDILIDREKVAKERQLGIVRRKSRAEVEIE